jgi:hypothetical protein
MPKISLETAKRRGTYARTRLDAELRNRGYPERILRVSQSAQFLIRGVTYGTMQPSRNSVSQWQFHKALNGISHEELP